MEKGTRALQTNAAAVRNGWIWLFDRNINALFRWEIASGRVEYVLSVRDEEAYQKSLFSDIFFYKNELFLVAFYAKKNVLINLEDMSQKKVDCKRLDNLYHIKTDSSVQWGSKIYMFPKFWGDNIVVWDFEDNLFREIEVDYGTLSKHIQMREDRNTWCGGRIVNGEFWLASRFATKIVRLNEQGDMNVYSVNTADVGFNRMNIWEDKFFLTPCGGRELIKFDIGTRKSKMMFQGDNLFSDQYFEPYGGIAIVDDMLVLLPFKTDQVVMLNLNTKEITKWDIGNVRFHTWVQVQEYIYMLPYLGNEICILNVKTGTITKRECNRPLMYKGKDFYQYWMEEISRLCGTEMIYSETVCNIEQFLESALISESNKNIQNSKRIGMKILETIQSSYNSNR